jgi:hypothetical protein
MGSDFWRKFKDERIVLRIHPLSKFPPPDLKFANFFFDLEVLFTQRTRIAFLIFARSHLPVVHNRLNLGLASIAQHHRDLFRDQWPVEDEDDGSLWLAYSFAGCNEVNDLVALGYEGTRLRKGEESVHQNILESSPNRANCGPGQLQS